MKIVENKKENYINFEDLEIGEVFKFDDIYYLKIENIKVGGEYFINAVSMDSGEVSLFCNDIEIIPIKATLVIDED